MARTHRQLRDQKNQTTRQFYFHRINLSWFHLINHLFSPLKNQIKMTVQLKQTSKQQTDQETDAPTAHCDPGASAVITALQSHLPTPHTNTDPSCTDGLRDRTEMTRVPTPLSCLTPYHQTLHGTSYAFHNEALMEIVYHWIVIICLPVSRLPLGMFSDKSLWTAGRWFNFLIGYINNHISVS